MTDRIKAHLDSLLLGAPKTRRIEELRQELLAGCLDKYYDLTENGADPESAYREVVDGIGNVSELLGHIEKAEAFDPVDAEEKRRKRAFFTSAGICCYFIAAAMLILFGYAGYGAVGFALMIVFSGIATMLVVFGRMMSVSKYEKAEDTLVEELKVQMAQGKSANKMMGLASSTLWSFTVVLYLISSFLTMRWNVTWMLFIFAAAVQCVLSAWLLPQSRRKTLTGAYWCLVAAIYLVISFTSFKWHITWVIFPLAVAIQQAIRLLEYWRSQE